MSPWWLFLIIPFCTFFGYILCGFMSFGAQEDKCQECQYNCKTCPYKKEKSK